MSSPRPCSIRSAPASRRIELTRPTRRCGISSAPSGSKTKLGVRPSPVDAARRERMLGLSSMDLGNANGALEHLIEATRLLGVPWPATKAAAKRRTLSLVLNESRPALAGRRIGDRQDAWRPRCPAGGRARLRAADRRLLLCHRRQGVRRVGRAGEPRSGREGRWAVGRALPGIRVRRADLLAGDTRSRRPVLRQPRSRRRPRGRRAGRRSLGAHQHCNGSSPGRPLVAGLCGGRGGACDRQGDRVQAAMDRRNHSAQHGQLSGRQVRRGSPAKRRAVSGHRSGDRRRASGARRARRSRPS